MKFTNSMFDEIKNAMSSKAESAFKDMLKFEAGKSYLLRIVPNVNEPRRTLFHYYHHSWNSLSTNKFVSVTCPSTFGESCPICNQAIKTYRSGSSEEKEKNKLISRKENWLANVYVVTDPTNSDNVGKVKILRYGRELAKIITEAMEGEDSQEYGVKIFDILNGCSLRVKCEARGNSPVSKQFVTYGASKFVSPSTLDDLDADSVSDIHANIFKLDEVFKKVNAPTLQRMLDQHYFCVEDAETLEEELDEEVAAKPKLELPKKLPSKKVQSNAEDMFEGVEEAKEVKKSKKDDDDDFYDEELRDILSKI